MNAKIVLKPTVALVSLFLGSAQAGPQLVYMPLDTTCRVVDTRGFSSPFEADKLTQSFRAFGSKEELDRQRDNDNSDSLTACEPAPDLTPAAMAANVTAVAARHNSQGNMVAYPAGSAAPESSLVNFRDNNIANASIISLSTDNDNDAYFDIQAQLFGNQPENKHKVDVVVDAMGYFYDKTDLDEATAASGLTYVPLANPCRIVDTRGFNTPLTQDNDTQSFIAWGGKTDLDAQRDSDGSEQLPACEPVSGATPSAMASNVTVVAKRYQSKGNIVTYPSDSETPIGSLINFKNNNIANASILSLSSDNDQHFKVQANLFGDNDGFNQYKTDVVVDVMGYFYPQTEFEGQSDRPDMAYTPLPSPCRIVNTRSDNSAFEYPGHTTQSFRGWETYTPGGQQDNDNDTKLLDCLPEVDSKPAAVVANITAVAKPYHARGNLVVYPFGSSQPGSSLVNFNNNNIANASILSLNTGTNHHFSVQAQLFGKDSEIDNQRKADIIMDAMGYFYPLADPISTAPGTTSRVSVNNNGSGAHSLSTSAAISGDGRFVAFSSIANNLTGGDNDNNDKKDIFVHDRQSAETQRVSVASDGSQSNNTSETPAFSTNGQFVVFYSTANNLVDNDTNSTGDIFVHNRQTTETQRVSIASDGTQGDKSSSAPTISANGRYVAFKSGASNLVDNDTNNGDDIFVHDRQTGNTQRVSIASDGSEGNNFSFSPAISADGRFVAFESKSSNLVDNDTNDKNEIFVHDRQTGITQRVSVASDGTQGNFSSKTPSISADGRFVAFISEASNLVTVDTNGVKDVFVHDRQSGETRRVSVADDGTEGDNPSLSPSINADGRFVAFESEASNLVTGDTNDSVDTFVHNLDTHETRRVSIADNSTEGNLDSIQPTISANGAFVAFQSSASNLTSDDTSHTDDIFVHELAPWFTVD